ncbi:UNVERIFIED_CONTAM: hypothetical protein Slati_1713400 [Sesamum latifolium]|uniref:Secreted protein n=1 Tax=Sesamum latifolium TaxID=2727402 RepID=A0AAW2WVZ6_9LAMI
MGSSLLASSSCSGCSSISFSLNKCLLGTSRPNGVTVRLSCWTNAFLPASSMSLRNSLLVICTTGSVCLEGSSSLLGVSPHLDLVMVLRSFPQTAPTDPTSTSEVLGSSTLADKWWALRLK